MNGCCSPSPSTSQFSNGTDATSADESPTPLRPMVLFATAMSLSTLVLMLLYCTYWRRQNRGDAPASSDDTGTALDPTILQSIPLFVYASTASSAAAAGTREENLLREDCAVCLGEFREGEKGRVLPPCRHKFHVDCVDPWLRAHPTCPVCRGAIMPPGMGTITGKTV